MNLVREPDAGNPPVRFDEREVETEHGMRLLRHGRGNPETEYVEAYPTAPPLDSTTLMGHYWSVCHWLCQCGIAVDHGTGRASGTQIQPSI